MAPGGARPCNGAAVHRILLDTSSLLYRAYFGLSKAITDAEGRPAQAVHGYLDMTARLVRDRGPAEVVHCLDDDWRPAARVAAYAGYKAHRPPDPEGLPEQAAALAALLGALGATTAWSPGWEADDVVGTLCARAGPGERVDVVTGDRDLLQVVRDGDPAVRVLFTVKGVSELAVFDEAAVEARYGVAPSRYADLAILRGDPSDGLPGVKGVGEKTARALVQEHGSLDGVLAATTTLTPRLAERLAAAGDYLEAMRVVVPVRTDVAVEEERTERDDALLDALAARHGATGPVRRLRAALAAADADGSPA